MRFIDFSSWQTVLSTVIGLALFALIGIGIRILVMFTIQQRQQRMNRQINERLRALMSAYKVLGGSFTGNLSVDPGHLRDLRRVEPATPAEGEGETLEQAETVEMDVGERPGAERRRQIRDAVEAALSDIFLLGTEDQVRLAERAARELVAGHPVQTHELVVSLRDFVRKALDLEPIPGDLDIPMQGPTRPSSSGGRGRSGAAGQGGRGGGNGGGGGMGGGGMGGGGMGGMGLGGRPESSGGGG